MTRITIDVAMQQAVQLHQTSRLLEAEAIYRRILTEHPKHAGALHLLGLIALEKNQLDVAIELIQRAIAINPDDARAYSNLASALRQTGKIDDAITACRRALRLNPDYPQALNNLGNAMRDNGQLDEAIITYNQALHLVPDYADAHKNLGNAHFGKGQFHHAIVAYSQAIKFRPDFAQAHHALGVTNLLIGNFNPGWLECEWRWQSQEKFTCQPRQFSQPQWNGKELNARTILLYVEQGFGDSIQFVRYVSLVARRGGRIVLACQPELKRLFAGMAGIQKLICHDEKIPFFDLHCPLLSLPLALATELETIPREIPYLQAHAVDKEKWRKMLQTRNERLRVGIAWAGSLQNKNDRHRSISLKQFAPLAKIPGLEFYSLQKDKSPADNSAFQLVDHTVKLNDFADTAGLIANLDLIITVDTAVAHLAGAMGKNVWTMLPFAPDWRWLLHTDDSPWYPTMRLFRQTKPGDWAGVIDRVADALKQWAEKQSQHSHT